MKKLLHNELRDSAIALRERRIKPEVFFGKLITLLRDHFENLGLSDAAFRYWTYDRSPQLRRRVKHEFRPEIGDGLVKARRWIEAAANTSRAFTLDSVVKPPGGPPYFRSMVWRFYFRDLDAATAQSAKTQSDPIFYEASKYAPAEARRPLAVERAPGDPSAQNDKAADFGHNFV